jgi:probable phosphoglycerate mutase
MALSWPKTLWIVRHGQSAGNVAAELAEDEGADVVAVLHRDADVSLSALGERQSQALGRWFGRMTPRSRPTLILTSPYRRALRTAELIAHECHAPIEIVVDERLRERDLGAFDRLTERGWSEHYPEEAERRKRMGKFYHRPPGGESWCDAVLRLRTLVQEIRIQHAGTRLLVVTHQVIVLSLRYILEHLDEASILQIDREAGVPHCSSTSYASPNGRRGLQLVLENYVEPIERVGEPVTVGPQEPAGSQ